MKQVAAFIRSSKRMNTHNSDLYHISIKYVMSHLDCQCCGWHILSIPLWLVFGVKCSHVRNIYVTPHVINALQTLTLDKVTVWPSDSNTSCPGAEVWTEAESPINLAKAFWDMNVFVSLADFLGLWRHTALSQGVTKSNLSSHSQMSSVKD